jgi:hypothetical protein
MRIHSPGADVDLTFADRSESLLRSAPRVRIGVDKRSMTYNMRRSYLLIGRPTPCARA